MITRDFSHLYKSRLISHLQNKNTPPNASTIAYECNDKKFLVPDLSEILQTTESKWSLNLLDICLSYIPSYVHVCPGYDENGLSCKRH